MRGRGMPRPNDTPRQTLSITPNFSFLTPNYKEMFDSLSERLERSFKILKGEGKITEINVAETLKDVRRALLDADVNYKVAKNFTDTVKKKALGQNVINALKPKELMVKIVHDEMTEMMGGEEAPLNIEGPHSPASSPGNSNQRRGSARCSSEPTFTAPLPVSS